MGLNIHLYLLILIPATLKANSTDFRLPQNILVQNYELNLKLDYDAFVTNKFTGICRINFITIEPVQEVKLHANGIIVNKFHLYYNTNTAINTSGSRVDSDKLTDSITVKANLTEYELYTLHFEYEGLLRTTASGLYKSSYVDESGNVRYLASTKLKPLSARKVFPCFDEPSFKAVFDLSLTYPKQYNAIANTPALGSVTNGNLTTTSFEPTPIMSTYLLNFIISELTCTRGTDIEPGVPFSVCSIGSESSARNFSLEVTPKLVQALERYTKFSYNIPVIGQLELVAAPENGQESWGLNILPNTHLLWYDNESVITDQQIVAQVVAHILAHAWFGGLVTPKWWSDTFLSEGLASHLEYYITAEMFPKWNLEKQFNLDKLQAALHTDILSTSHPLSYQVTTQQEVRSLISSISSNKGASILRMIEHTIGSQNYQKGINLYLTNNMFNNTVPNDLWTALGTWAINLPNETSLVEVMDNWTYRAGFPVVSVLTSGNSIILSQERLQISGSDRTKWYIPITYTISNNSNHFLNTTPNLWLTPKTDNLILYNVLRGSNWIILNNQQIGYYRVNYDHPLWENISFALKQENFSNIPDLTRAQVVDDLFSFAKVGLHDYAHILNYTFFLYNDTSYFSWRPAFQAFGSLLQHMADDAQTRSAFSNLILLRMDKLVKSVPFDIDINDQTFTLKKVLALSWACKLGHKDCISYVLTAFGRYKNTTIRPNKNLREIIYCNDLRYGNNSKNWDFLWGRYKNTSLTTEQQVIISSLGCTKNRTILLDYLKKSVHANSGIRPQHALSVISSVLKADVENVNLVLDFFIDHFANQSNQDPNKLRFIVTNLADRLSNSAQYSRFAKFIQSTNLDSIFVNNTLSSVQDNLKWSSSLQNQFRIYFGTNAAQCVKSTMRITFIITTILVLLQS